MKEWGFEHVMNKVIAGDQWKDLFKQYNWQGSIYEEFL